MMYKFLKQYFLVVFMAVCPLWAVADPTLEIDMDQVEVRARRAQTASEALRVISVVERDDLQRIPVQNINELLEQLPGIDIRQRGVNGVQADISMRGGTSDQVLVLLNGVNITDPQTGHHNLNLPIDLSQVERIELLQGTSMSLFGLSAFSGAINIITSTEVKGADKGYEVDVQLAAGEHGLFNPTLAGRLAVGQWQMGASVSHNQSKGYMENTDYAYTNAFVQATCAGERSGKWHLQAGGQLKGFGANSFYSLKFPNQYEATKTLFASAQWEKRIERFSLSSSAFYRTHYDRFELIRGMEDAPAWYVGHNYHVTHTAGLNFKASYASSIGKTNVGVELRNEKIKSNVLGDELDVPQGIPFTADSLFFTHGQNRLNLNYFAEQAFYAGNWSASVGFSGNYNNMFDHNWSFGANVGYHFARDGYMYLNVSRALRLPTFTDLYYKSATQIANPALRPEKAYVAELGAKWRRGGLSAQASGFYRWGQDIIDWVKTPQEEKWRSMNHTRVDAMGGEVSVGYQHNEWLKNVAATYSFVHLDKRTEGDLMSKYALDYLRHKFTVQLDHGIYRGFGASWQLNVQAREGVYEDVEGAVTTYEPVVLVDGRIYWRNEIINVFVEASNLLNVQYYDYGGVRQPQRWFKTGVALAL